MKLNDIDPYQTEITDFDNFFGVNLDDRGNYTFNLNETMYISANEDNMKTFVCRTECYWPLISYQIYDTTRLAWLLMKVNGVKASRMFEKKMPGEKIKYIPIDTVNYILGIINK